MDETTKRMIAAGLQPGTAGPSGEPMVPIQLDGQKKMVPASEGTYYAVSNMSNLLQQFLFLLNGIHHHLAYRAQPKHPKQSSMEVDSCPTCVAINDARRQALEQVGAEVNEGTPVMDESLADAMANDPGPPDPEGDVKADVERAKAAVEWAEAAAAAAAEESQDEDV